MDYISKPSRTLEEVSFPLTLTRKEPFPNPFTDHCISKMDIKIEELKVCILKNNFGSKVASLDIKKLMMKKSVKDNETNLKLIGQIALNYLNKRKNSMEPVLEPWIF